MRNGMRKCGASIALGALLGMVVAVEATSVAQARLLSIDEVRAIALSTVPGGQDLEIELRTDAGGAQGLYEVELHDARGVEHELGIDATSGAVLYETIDD